MAIKVGIMVQMYFQGIVVTNICGNRMPAAAITDDEIDHNRSYAKQQNDGNPEDIPKSQINTLHWGHILSACYLKATSQKVKPIMMTRKVPPCR
jgi:hypothetical protein